MKLVKRMLMLIFFILGILTALYGVSVMLLRSGTKFFLVWYGISILLFLLAALCRWKIWETLPGVLRILLAMAFFTGILLFSFVEIRIMGCAGAAEEKDLSYLVVLGAQVREDGPSSVLKRRLDKAVEYMKENPDTLCIVTGGQGPIEPWEESRGMADYLLEQGVAEARIIQENQALNTVQNIQFSMKLMEDSELPVGIVTNDFHVFRGLAIAKHQGLKNACPIAAPSSSFYKPNNLLREFFGVLKDVSQKNMSISSVMYGEDGSLPEEGIAKRAEAEKAKEQAEKEQKEKAEAGEKPLPEKERVQSEILYEEEADEEYDRDYTDYVQGEVTLKELKNLGYPSSLISLYRRNKEARDFVLDYAIYDEMNKDPSDIDISAEVKKGKYPHFLQWDERWGYEYYGDDYLSVTGCGPTALTVVYCGLTGDHKKNPLTVAKMAEKRDLVVGKQGSKWSIMTELGSELGLQVYESYPDAEVIKSELKQKHPIIAIMGKGRFTEGGHFIVLCGIDKKGRIVIRDSNSVDRTKKHWKVETLLEEMQDMWVYSK
ncbi:MAG: YdcF family protein [Dorea sp.]|nr:YdcF family protein [Dorea sp.]